jgi:hypothetical protein
MKRAGSSRHVYFLAVSMIDQSWLNPNIAEAQLVTLALVFLASLILLPVIFGLVLYLVLGLLARLTAARHHAPGENDLPDEREHG